MFFCYLPNIIFLPLFFLVHFYRQDKQDWRHFRVRGSWGVGGGYRLRCLWHFPSVQRTHIKGLESEYAAVPFQVQNIERTATSKRGITRTSRFLDLMFNFFSTPPLSFQHSHLCHSSAHATRRCRQVYPRCQRAGCHHHEESQRENHRKGETLTDWLLWSGFELLIVCFLTI